MTDAEIIHLATEFRRGLLGRKSARLKCAVVTWPLAGYLEFNGVECAVDAVRLPQDSHAVQHVFIALPDGRVLDATADQFNRRGRRAEYPKVYLGPRLYFHEGPQP